MMLVTVQQAKAHLRVDPDWDGDDEDIELKVHVASGLVLTYLKNHGVLYEYERDSDSEIVLDSDGEPTIAEDIDGKVLRYEVKGAVLILTGILYRDRDGQEMVNWAQGYLPAPVTALLYPLRDPVFS